jgi:hypothetical protein
MEKVQVVIPSRKRSHMVGKAAALFVDPIVCIDEDELGEYKRKEPALCYVTHPSKFNTLQLIRQWILDNIKEDVIFQCDDDVHKVWSLVGHRQRRIRDPLVVQDIILNAALNCREAGTVMFFFSHTSDPRQCRSPHPFLLVSQPVGNAMGFWRKEFNEKIRFDPAIQHGGLDAAMRCLFHYRIVWCDTRFCFQPGPHMTLEGGLAGVRTAAGMDYDDAILKKRYGDAIDIDHYSTAKNTKGGGRRQHIHIRVDR